MFVIKPELYKKLYPESRIAELANRQHAMLGLIGKPQSRKAKLWRRIKSRLWHRPWAWIHRALPGDCDCL